MISDDMQEAYHRLSHFRDNKRVRIVAQPFRDINNPHQVIPQWQKDIAMGNEERILVLVRLQGLLATHRIQVRRIFLIINV